MQKRKSNNNGLTLIELLISIAIIAVLSTAIAIKLVPFRQKTSFATTLNNFSSDVKQQQIKAMIGDTEGSATTSAYGIYFAPNQYTLFKGDSYSATDSSNFTVSLDPALSFYSVSFPSNTLVFSKGNGEISGFVNGLDNVVLKEATDNIQKTIRFNLYGIILSIQ